ncbi:MAG: serine hydrolase [Pseudomonadales bacterium]|nr:serine hydrolase [Pseudomonadales bacterium]
MHKEIDDLLRVATESTMTAVSAVVCDSGGQRYEGAFGSRAPNGSPMTVDTVGAIMSMTKAVTGVAAMQCVERGQLSLDAPAGEICPYLGVAKVFTGYDDNGEPILRDSHQPITLRNLLTHSSGFVYEIWNSEAIKVQEKLGLPSIMTLQKKSLEVPLMFDPGERWEYGIGIDWVGQMIETVSGTTLGEYFQEHITEPLGMQDTGFAPSEAMLAKMMAMLVRDQEGALVAPPEAAPGPAPEFEMGGGGLLSSATDYSRFLTMLLRGGELDGARILEAETVDLMAQNHLGDLRVTKLPSSDLTRSQDAEFFPGDEKSWGLTFQINEEAGFTGRPKGTLMWAGLSNCCYWIDRQNDLAGVFVSQVLPFADPACLDTFYQFEKLVYEHTR